MEFPASTGLIGLVTSSVLMILAAIVIGSALSGAMVKRLAEGGAAGSARLVTVLGAVMAALAPYAGLVVAAIVAGPPPGGPIGIPVALGAIVAGYVGLFLATRSWPAVFKIIVLIIYTLFLGYSLFMFALMLACGLYHACV